MARTLRSLIVMLVSIAPLAQPARVLAQTSPADSEVNWSQFHFSADHKGVNPLETTLNTSNVSGLHEVWSGHTDDEIGLSSAAVAGGVAYIGSYDGRLYAFDAVTGALLWKTASTGLREAAPAVSNGLVYSLAIGGLLMASDAATGRRRWSAHTSAAICPITIANGMVFVVGASVEAYDARSGSLIWATPLPEPSQAGATVFQGQLFAVGGHHAYSLDAATGTMLWQKSLDVFQVSTPAVAGGLVYVGDFVNGFVYALRAGNGSTAWRFDTNGGLTDSSPAVAGGVVYIGDYSNDAVWALDASTGAMVWEAQGGGSQGSVSVANGVVYAASYWGDAIFAFDAATGATLWSSPLGVHSQSTPVIVNGMVYVGATDGNLHAFGL
jgi:outer membrane protein assembly factor BamB